MMALTIQRRGFTADSFRRAAQSMRPEMARAVEGIMHKARIKMTALASGPVLHRKSGRTAAAISRSKVKTEITATSVRGILSNRAFLLNIHEGGATIPAVTIRATKKKAIRFTSRGGFTIFVHRGGTKRRIGETGVITIPSRRLPARPIGKRILDDLTPELQERLRGVIQHLLEREAAS